MRVDLANLESEEKLQHILDEINKGKDRDEIADSLGYKSYKSMDGFVRRQGYTWDKNLKKYLLPKERNSGRYSPLESTVGGKVGEVLKLFVKGELDAREVAKQVGFDNHRELALYMKSKGYQWNAEIDNYQLEETVDTGEVSVSSEATGEAEGCTFQIPIQDRHQELLNYLLQKEKVLKQLLDKEELADTEGLIPRYAVPGIFVTKSVHMTNQLDQMVRDFSKDKNISQRELFEVALVELFQKYGYRKEVETLLQQK